MNRIIQVEAMVLVMVQDEKRRKPCGVLLPVPLISLFYVLSLSFCN